MPGNAIYVARPGVWGNPFKVGSPSGIFDNGTVLVRALTIEQCLEFYRNMILGIVTPEMHPWAQQWIAKFHRNHGKITPADLVTLLEGFDLCCWCPIVLHGVYVPCHADVLLSLANNIPMDEVIRENTRRAEGQTVR